MLFTWTAGAITTVIALLMAPASDQPKLANGSPARAQVTGQWVLSRTDREAIGIVTQAVACPGRLYLLALVKNTIYQTDLKQPALGIALGPDVLGTVAKNPGELVNFFADCRGNRLSVVVNPFRKDASSIVTFDLETQRIVRTFELPPEFSPSVTNSPQYDEATRRVFLGGIWPSTRNGWLIKPIESALTDSSFGLVLSIDNGRASRFLPGTEKGCRSWIAHCLDSLFAQSQQDEWVFSHGLGAQLSVIRLGKVIRSLDMRSPMFRYVPGDSVPRKAPREAGLTWAYRNSEIRGLFVVDGQIVGVHAHHTTEQAKAGGWIDFTAYVNVFTREGSRVHADLLLSGLPIGASSNAVWVASYRPERNDQAREIVVQRVAPRPAPAP
jgi:hypothetical protein